MALWKKKSDPIENHRLVQVKSKFDSEFRRFSLPRPSSKPTSTIVQEEDHCWSFEAFLVLIKKLHRLENILFSIFYTDSSDGDLLPINNNDNFRLALIRANPLLRLFVVRDQGEPWTPLNLKSSTFQPTASSRFFSFGFSEETHGSYSPSSMIAIGRPKHFRHISTLIDVDQLPPTQRKVRLRKSAEDGRPLGFCIRDGWNVKEDAEGKETRTRGIFISRLIPGGLAESTGLLSIDDEILEVNGNFIANGSKTLDQVTDMMVANAKDLIITIRTPDRFEDTSRDTLISNKSQVSRSVPNTPDSMRSLKIRSNLRAKRNEVASSVFYVDESENESEDHVIDFTAAK